MLIKDMVAFLLNDTKYLPCPSSMHSTISFIWDMHGICSVSSSSSMIPLHIGQQTGLTDFLLQHEVWSFPSEIQILDFIT